MAIRTNSTTWFRTTYTGSETPFIHSTNVSNGDPFFCGVGNNNGRQTLYFSEPSRSNFEAVYNPHFRDYKTPAVSIGQQDHRVFIHENVGTQFTTGTEQINYQLAALSGQSGDPYSNMHIFQRLTGANLASNRFIENVLNSSASINDVLYWQVSSSIGAGGNVQVNGGSHKMSLKYTYNDSNLIWHTKTVRIPINSLIGSSICGGTLQILDKSGSFPALDTFLPEISKSYKDIVVEFYSFTSVNATTSCSLLYNIDNGTTFSSSLYRNDVNGAVFGYDTWRLNTSSFDTSISHSIYIGSTLANTFSQLGAIVNVTYTYNVPSSSRILNSVVLNGLSDPGTLQASTAANYRNKKFLISEPGTINLRQSGYLLFCTSAVTRTVSFKCGSQNFVNYRLLQGSVNSGNYPIIHRIDSDSSGSTALTLTRGYNDFKTSWYADATDTIGGFSGLLILNYESDKSSLGVGAHNHTLNLTITGSTVSTQNNTFLWPSASFIPESNYYINDAAPLIYRFINTAIEPYQFMMYYTGSERQGLDSSGSEAITSLADTDAEYGTRIFAPNISNFIQRYPNDTSTEKMNIQTRRRYILQSIANCISSAEMYLTYNSLTFTITGSIEDYTGNGAMQIKIFDVVQNKMVLSSSSGIGGNISETWYEDVNNLQIIAYNSSSYAVSDIKPAGSGSFSISFASASVAAGGEHSYTWIG